MTSKPPFVPPQNRSPKGPGEPKATVDQARGRSKPLRKDRGRAPIPSRIPSIRAISRIGSGVHVPENSSHNSAGRSRRFARECENASTNQGAARQW